MTALRDPRFRRLLVGQALSGFGDTALYLSLAIWVKDLTGSNGAAGAVFFALGAMSLLAPLSGYVVDRVAHRRRLLVITDLATALAVCALLLVHSRGQLWVIYAVAAAYGLAGTIVGPATSALLKDLLRDDELGGANAARQVLGQGLRLLSPLVGAGLYAAVGGGWLAGFDALTFLASIVAVLGVRLVESPPQHHGERPPLRGELAAGFRHIAAVPLLRRLAVACGLAMLGLGLLESIDFAVVAALGRPPTFFGALLSVQGAGSIAGGLVVVRLLRRWGEGRLVGLGLAVCALACAGLAVRSLPVVAASVALLGVAVSWFFVGLMTALQRLTPPRLQGRVSAASFVLTDIPQTASIACGAVLISAVDYRLLLAALCAVLVGCTALLVPGRAGTAEPGTDRPTEAERAVSGASPG